MAVLEDGAPLSEALAAARPALGQADAALARHLVASVLKRLGQLDDLIDHCLERPLPRRNALARHILRLGAAQLFFAQVQAHAAVATSVALVDAYPRMRALKGLVNAVLRRLAGAQGKAWLAGQDAARLNCPAWLWRAWCEQYGEATTRAIVEATLAPPPLDLTPRDEAAGETLLRACPAARRLATGTIRLMAPRPVSQIPGYGQGAWWVQDAAALLPARLAFTRPGARVADLCAAPGGKTMALCAMGADVTAVDQSPSRLQRLRENLARTRFKADIVCAALESWQPQAPFDAVLLDAPCSATGTIRRRPDIWHAKRPGDIAALARVQAALLARAAGWVKVGGQFVYSVCSLERAEGEAQIAGFLAHHPEWRRDPILPAMAPGLGDAITGEGALRLRPDLWRDEGGLDGFYIARLERVAPALDARGGKRLGSSRFKNKR